MYQSTAEERCDVPRSDMQKMWKNDLGRLRPAREPGDAGSAGGPEMPRAPRRVQGQSRIVLPAVPATLSPPDQLCPAGELAGLFSPSRAGEYGAAQVLNGHRGLSRRPRQEFCIPGVGWVPPWNDQVPWLYGPINDAGRWDPVIADPGRLYPRRPRRRLLVRTTNCMWTTRGGAGPAPGARTGSAAMR